jgi:hypothetical protein
MEVRQHLRSEVETMPDTPDTNPARDEQHQFNQQGADDTTALKQKSDQLIKKLKELGGRAGNKTLRDELGWPEEEYWPIRDYLVNDGRLALGKGKGGSVKLLKSQEVVPEGIVERDLYDDVADVLRKEWAKHNRFREYIVEVTAHQGKKDTGGTWTRPDIVVAALRVFPHVLGKFFDIITFEIKSQQGIDITAVYEALAHRRAATKAYIWLHAPKKQGEKPDEELEEKLARIEAEASRLGIGMIVAEDPSKFATWDERVVAERIEPDPAALNDFIAQQLSDTARTEMAPWFR